MVQIDQNDADGPDIGSLREAAVEELASRLYLRLEIAMPGAEAMVEWKNLPPIDRHIYRNIISDLSRYGELWRVII